MSDSWRRVVQPAKYCLVAFLSFQCLGWILRRYYHCRCLSRCCPKLWIRRRSWDLITTVIRSDRGLTNNNQILPNSIFRRLQPPAGKPLTNNHASCQLNHLTTVIAAIQDIRQVGGIVYALRVVLHIYSSCLVRQPTAFKAELKTRMFCDSHHSSLNSLS